MIDLTTYALLRKQIATAASGISDVRAEGDELVFVLVDGHEVRMAIPATEIRDAVVRDDVLVLTLADGKEVVVDTTLTQSGQAADAKVTGDALACKLTEPSTGLAVGKYFRIAAIDENGHAVLEAVDAPVGGVQDVLVAGASVVTDGVASVPQAGNDGVTKGVICVNSNSGIIVNATTGIANLDRASNDGINTQRTNAAYRRPITPYILDYAVKAAMCDGKGAAWSEAEQAAARERMGVKGTYRHIAKITVEKEGTKAMVVTVDENGNSFSLSDVTIYTYSPITDDTSAANGYFIFNESGGMFGPVTIKGNETKPKYNMAWLSCCGTIPVMLFSHIGVTGDTANIGPISLSFGNKIDTPFEAADRIKWNGNGTIPPGTTFDIWGVDA